MRFVLKKNKEPRYKMSQTYKVSFPVKMYAKTTEDRKMLETILCAKNEKGKACYNISKATESCIVEEADYKDIPANTIFFLKNFAPVVKMEKVGKDGKTSLKPRFVPISSIKESVDTQKPGYVAELVEMKKRFQETFPRKGQGKKESKKLRQLRRSYERETKKLVKENKTLKRSIENLNKKLTDLSEKYTKIKNRKTQGASTKRKREATKEEKPTNKKAKKN